MLFFVDVAVDSKGLPPDQLWELWEKEVDAAHGALEAGMIRSLYKVAGDRRVVGIVDVPDHDTLDRVFMAGLPMSDNLIINEISPVREYVGFGADIKARWSS